jgi:hypothetical protein
VYHPEHFPKIEPEERGQSIAGGIRTGLGRNPGHLSQSERDWAYARRALSRGEQPEAVVAAIARFRRGAKHDVRYYAELTVRKAAQSLEATARHEPPGPDR